MVGRPISKNRVSNQLAAISWLLSLLACGAAGAARGAQDPPRLTPETVMAVDWVGQAVVHPAGDRIVYPVSTYLPAEMRRKTQLWLLDLATGQSRSLTTGESATSPEWAPGSDRLYFLRKGQVWQMRMGGGEPEQVTDIPGGIRGFRCNPDSEAPPEARFLVHRPVDPNCPPADWTCTAAARSRWQERPGLVSELFPLRHWSSWRDSLRNHVFLGNPATNSWFDLTPGQIDCPSLALAGGADYNFNPSGGHVALIMNLGRPEALSTDNDIYLLPLATRLEGARGESGAVGAIGAGVRQTAGVTPNWDRYRVSRGLSGGGGNDDHPAFSPDGRYLAYCSMRRAGYESDLRQIVLHDLASGAERCLTCDLDRSAGCLTWSLDGRFLYFVAYDREASALYRITIATGVAQRVLRAGSIGALAALPDGRLLLNLGSSRMPGEIFSAEPNALLESPGTYAADLAPAYDGRFGRPERRLPADAPLRQLTFHNWPALAPIAMNAPVHFTFTGALGDSVHGMVLFPPASDPGSAESRRASQPESRQASQPGSQPASLPLVVVLHGGPQWAYHDFWMGSYNFQMLAAAGYVVATVNFHGSTGFGIGFQDAIRRQWGTVPAEDVERGLDHLLAHYPRIDPGRIAAIGRSYGGYLVNWLNGHSDRFQCLVAHSGPSNEYAGWGTTEELWFPEWEFGSVPWEHARVYWDNSPLEAAAAMRTPTLIVHGQRDYRVDLSEGLQVYTTLRRQGVPARFLTFENEGHHIKDAAAWLFMWREVLGWLDRYLR